MALSIAMIFFAASVSHAQFTPNAANTAYGAYGLYPVGSTRVLGMGGAFTGLADDSSAVVTNPAGLGFNKYILDYTTASNRVVNREVFFGRSDDREGLPYTAEFQAGSLRMGPLAIGAASNQTYVLDVDTNSTGPTNRKQVIIESYDAAAALVFFKRLSLGATMHSETAKIAYTNPDGRVLSDKQKSAYPTFGLLFKMNNQASVGASYTPERRYNFDESLDSQLTPTIGDVTEWFHDVVIPAKISLGLSFKTKKNLNWVGDVDIYQPVSRAMFVGGQSTDSTDTILNQVQTVLHGGFEFFVAREKALDFIWRGGGYREPRRVENASDRLHFTMGVEVRFYYIVLAASYDQAPGFSNVAQSAGLSLGDF